MARFLRDIKDGNLVALERAVASNPSVIRAKEPGTERTALHLAAQYRQCEVIDLLLAANAQTDLKDAQGAVPLHIAVQTGNASCVAALLGRGNKVAVKFKNNIGYTPLHLAAKLGHTRVAAELLAVGANASLKDQRGKTPADHVPRVGNYEELAEMLRSAAAEPQNGRMTSPALRSPPAASLSRMQSPMRTPSQRGYPFSPKTSLPSRTGRPPSRHSYLTAEEVHQRSDDPDGHAAIREQVQQEALKQAAKSRQLAQAEQAANAQQTTELSAQRAQLQAQAAELQRQEAQYKEQQQALLQQQAAAQLEAAHGARADQKRLNSKVAELESNLEGQSAATQAAAKLAASVRDTQSDMAQQLRIAIFERQDELNGETVTRLASIEGRLRAQAAAQEYVQSKLSEMESRLLTSENSRIRIDGMISGNEPIAAEVLLKVEAIERKMGAVEQQRFLFPSNENRTDGISYESGNGISELDSNGVEAHTMHMPTNGSFETKEARQLRKQGDQLANLVRKFGNMEEQLQAYHNARDVMEQEQMQTPEFMTVLRTRLEEVCSATSSDPSSTSTTYNAVIRGSEDKGNGHSHEQTGPPVTAAGVAAIVAALEGLTKEVGLVRCRTAQMGIRMQTTDSRVSIMEDQYSKVRMKMRQMREWFNLGLPQKPSSLSRGRSRSRGLPENDNEHPRTPETRALMQLAPASLRSQRSLSSLHNADSLSVTSMHFN